MAEVSAAAAVAALGYSIFAGERQAGATRKGLRLQERTQYEAQNAAIREAKIGEEEEKRAKQKSPDLNVLLADQMLPKKPGQTGVDANRLLLGRPGSLGYS